MLDWLFYPVALLYFATSGLLFLFGVNYMYLAFLARRAGRNPHFAPTLIDIRDLPRVTVQLPIYNELYVAERVIEAAGRLEYPADRLQIQVLDDSTDDTAALVRRVVSRLKARGVDVELRHRSDRSGFKAGALQAAMETATGEFIAIFDADFVPQSDFLLAALPYLDDPGVAFIQTRWGHLNREYSWLTRLQSVAIDAHFVIEQFARSRTGYWFNFNGTAGIWRRKAMEDAGGWQADTLTEDLDLSYRAFLRGWQARYERDIVTPAELPVDFNGFRRQQHRWARGSLECARKLLPAVWRAPITAGQKIQASIHLTGYTVHLMLFVLTLLYPLVVQYTGRYPGLSLLFGFAYLFSLTALAPTIFFAAGQGQQGRSWLRRLPQLFALWVIGSGLMVNTARAAAQILTKKREAFERTAKFGLAGRHQDWTRQRYQLRFDGIVLTELLLGLMSLTTGWTAALLGKWGIAFYAALFGVGLVTVAATTIVHSVRVFRSRKQRQTLTASEQAQMRAN